MEIGSPLKALEHPLSLFHGLFFVFWLVVAEEVKHVYLSLIMLGMDVHHVGVCDPYVLVQVCVDVLLVFDETLHAGHIKQWKHEMMIQQHTKVSIRVKVFVGIVVSETHGTLRCTPRDIIVFCWSIRVDR